MRNTNGVIAAAVCCILCCIAFVFWREDARYSLPTPKPEGLRQPDFGVQTNFAEISAFAGIRLGDAPVLLHFFNPDCPCSRFNIAHVRELAEQYKGAAQIVAVLETEGADAEETRRAFLKLNLNAPFIVDTSGAIAELFGVYSTPQAVVLTGLSSNQASAGEQTRRLFYRGNYNTSRYCTDKRTEFVRIALDSLIAGASARAPHFSPEATVAYGCELPANLRAR